MLIAIRLMGKDKTAGESILHKVLRKQKKPKVEVTNFISKWKIPFILDYYFV